LFVYLSVPILILILLFSYYENSAEIGSILDREIAKTQQLSVDDAEDFINPIASTLRLLAGMAAVDPELFRTEESRELLYRAVTSSEQIDAVYASFEDGYHRVVTRIDDDRRRSGPANSGGGKLALKLHRCPFGWREPAPASHVFRRMASCCR
jgi:adenylate cyclase